MVLYIGFIDLNVLTLECQYRLSGIILLFGERN